MINYNTITFWAALVVSTIALMLLIAKVYQKYKYKNQKDKFGARKNIDDKLTKYLDISIGTLVILTLVSLLRGHFI